MATKPRTEKPRKPRNEKRGVRKPPGLRFPAGEGPPPSLPPAEQVEQETRAGELAARRVQAEQAERDERGRFPKGVSGNPSGRPKGRVDVRAIMVEYFERHGMDIEEAAIAAILGVLNQAKAGDVPAAKLVLDRLFPQKIELGESFVDLIRGAWDKANAPPAEEPPKDPPPA